MEKFKLLDVVLGIFDEDPVPDEPGGEDGGEGTEEIVYGKPPEDVAGGDPESDEKENPNPDDPNPEDEISPEQEFEQLIKGKFKDVFNTRVQNTINVRFKQTKELEEGLEKMQPIMDILSEKYGNDISPEELVEKLENDIVEQLAYDKNTDVEAYRANMKLRRENERMQRIVQAEQQKQKTAENVRRWRTEEKTLKETYPDFSLDEWYQNPDFRKMIESGFPVETAYKAHNFDNLTKGVAKETEKAVTDNIKSKKRPKENAAKSKGVVFKSTPAKWDSKDIKEVERRVLNGEKISL